MASIDAQRDTVWHIDGNGPVRPNIVTHPREAAVSCRYIAGPYQRYSARSYQMASASNRWYHYGSVDRGLGQHYYHADPTALRLTSRYGGKRPGLQDDHKECAASATIEQTEDNHSADGPFSRGA